MRLSAAQRSPCQETVWTRDTYRYSGRGPSGFTMHYTRHQCRRSASDGGAYCWQHQPWHPGDAGQQEEG